ncbi:hypothetical protein KM043_002851 [Ampulex compressa]|nr:hypothetical protein KM043_002851 [Ampulex compressa]
MLRHRVSNSFDSLQPKNLGTPHRSELHRSQRRINPSTENPVSRLSSPCLETPGSPKIRSPTRIASPSTTMRYSPETSFDVDEDSREQSNDITGLKRALEMRYNAQLSSLK